MVSKVVWDLIDGKRTVREIERQALVSGEIPDSDAAMASLMFYAEQGMLTSPEEAPAPRKRIRTVSSFVTEVTLIWDATKIFSRVHRIVRPLLRASLFWASMVVVGAGILVFAPRFGAIFGDPRNFQILGSTVVGFLFYNFIVLGPVIIIHELCHGLALVHYSGRAAGVGTGLFYFGPMFYVDIAGYWSLPRRQRIMIMWVGNLSTLFIGSVIVLVGLLLPYPASISKILYLAAFWCFYMTLWNLAPPFETDGYHILSDILQMPNLRPDGFTVLRSEVLRLFRRPVPEASVPEGENRKILLGYAIFSIAFLVYIVVQSLRFTSYMAADAVLWVGRFWSSLVAGGALTLFAYGVGLTTIIYFVLTLSGYGVLVANLVKKSLIRGLRFETVHDRNLSVFIYQPPSLPASVANRIEKKMRSIAQGVTPNFSVGREGALGYASLRIGGGSLPFSQIKSHLWKVEKGFYQVYQGLLTHRGGRLAKSLVSSQGTGMNADLLNDMAGKTSPAQRSEIKYALKESLSRQEVTVRYLLSSTFSTVWAIEVPPSQHYELLTTLLSGVLVEDLITTNLIDEVEVFKKQTVYGLDSIAKLAAEAASSREEALAHPEKFHLMTLFEPVRGRLIFIGRTQRIEKHLNELGSLFHIQVWSGFLDNLLGDTSLTLNSIVQSLPQTPPEASALRDGEVRTLCRYVTAIEQLEGKTLDTLSRSRDIVQPCRRRVRYLRDLFHPEKKPQVGMFKSILALNSENLSSIPYGVKEVGRLLKEGISWVRGLEESLKVEQEKRQAAYLDKRKRLVGLYPLPVLLSGVLLATGLFQLATPWALPLAGAAAAIQVPFGAAYYLLRNSAENVPRYPSEAFSQMLTPMYALAQTIVTFTNQASLLKPELTFTESERKYQDIEAQAAVAEA